MSRISKPVTEQARRLHERIWQTPHLRVSDSSQVPDEVRAKFSPIWAGPKVSGAQLLFLGFDGVLYVDQLRDFGRLASVETWLRKHPAVLVVLTQPVHNAVNLTDLRPVFSRDIQPRVVGLLGKLDQQVMYIDKYAERVKASRWVALLAQIDKPHERPHWLIETTPGQGVRREQLDQLTHALNRSQQNPVY